MQSGLRNEMPSTRFVFSRVGFLLAGIFLRSMGATWYKRDLAFGFVLNLLW